MTPPIEDLAATHLACFGPEKAWDASAFRRYIDQPAIMVIGDATCFAVLQHVAGEAEILTLATHPTHQRQGRAAALIDHFPDYVPDLIAVFLEVDTTNAAARALYASCGFHQVGQRAAYYTHRDGPKTDALILRKDLT